MIKVVPPSEREAVRGAGTLDLDGIAGVLAEVYFFEYLNSRTPVIFFVWKLTPVFFIYLGPAPS